MSLIPFSGLEKFYFFSSPVCLNVLLFVWLYFPEIFDSLLISSLYVSNNCINIDLRSFSRVSAALEHTLFWGGFCWGYHVLIFVKCVFILAFSHLAIPSLDYSGNLHQRTDLSSLESGVVVRIMGEIRRNMNGCLCFGCSHDGVCDSESRVQAQVL